MFSGFMSCHRTKRFRSLKVIFVILAVMLMSFAFTSSALAGENQTEQDDWTYFLQLNLFAPDIDIETTLDQDITLSISDILDNLDMVYLGTFGASKNKWTFLVDVNLLNLGFDDTLTILDNPLVSVEVIDVEMSAWSVTPIVSYNLLDTPRVSFDVLTGARYLYIKLEADLVKSLLSSTTVDSISESGHNWNGIIGGRGNIYLKGNWFMPYYFDVGTGDIDLTWQAWTAIAYKFEDFALSLGYRHIEWDFDDDPAGDLIENLSASGPMIGIKYWF